jgi:hypothetical protein
MVERQCAYFFLKQDSDKEVNKLKVKTTNFRWKNNKIHTIMLTSLYNLVKNPLAYIFELIKL